MVAISQAPSPESNPYSPLPVISLVGPYPTINLIGQSFLWSIVLPSLTIQLQFAIVNNHLFTFIIFHCSERFKVHCRKEESALCTRMFHTIPFYYSITTKVNNIFAFASWIITVTPMNKLSLSFFPFLQQYSHIVKEIELINAIP